MRIRGISPGDAMHTGHGIALALRSAYLALHRRADATLARFGVTADQYVLLAALAEADALTQQDLTHRVSSDASTVRAMLLLLEGHGLVARGPHPSDGWVVTPSAPKSGHANPLAPPWSSFAVVWSGPRSWALGVCRGGS